MELREWALSILSADRLEHKLDAPESFTDSNPGSALFFKEPVRPPHMSFQRHSKEQKLPPFHEHHDPEKRATCLHRFAGHELLAVEMMAYALLAFPEAPKHFRRGLASTLKEEQEHVRLYIKEMARFDLNFGDLPLYRHFWTQVPHITSPLEYVSAMSLTFEMANLDFAPHYRDSFARYGDLDSAALMNRILEDEISHVSFGLNWLKRLKSKEESEWECWQRTLPHTIYPKRAKGFLYQRGHRQDAGIPEEWIERLRLL